LPFAKIADIFNPLLQIFGQVIIEIAAFFNVFLIFFFFPSSLAVVAHTPIPRN
jgi:hypothetical protein